MFWEFFRFDWKLQSRQPMLWIGALLFGFMAFMAIGTDAVTVGGAIGNVNRNAPAVIAQLMTVFTLLAMLLIAVFMAGSLLRDHELGTADLFFATPMRKGAYLFGRFFAGLSASLLIFVVVAVAMIVGTMMPWVDPKHVGAFTPVPYLWTFVVLVIPNLLFIGAFLCFLAATTRSLLSVYIGIVAFLVAWGVSTSMLKSLGNEGMATLLDPFGLAALSRTVRYWAAAERNTQLPTLAGYLLPNRALWLSMAAILMAATHVLFKPMRTGTGNAWLRRGVVPAPKTETPLTTAATVPLLAQRVPPRFGSSTGWQQFLQQWRFDTFGVLKSLPFLVMLILGIANCFGSMQFLDEMFGTKIYPVTHLMLDGIQGSFSFLLLIIVTFYAGELIWKERQIKLSDVTDAMPVSSTALMFAKLAALLSVVIAFELVGGVTAIVFQLTKSYTHFELSLYLQGLSLDAIPYFLMGVLALSLQVLTNNKFIGYLAILLIIVVQLAMGALHLDHHLYNYATLSPAPYSDMNGWGHFLPGVFAFALYWSLFAALLVLVMRLFWLRGIMPVFRVRMVQARLQLRGVVMSIGILLLLGFATCGGWIYYNTNVLNGYAASDTALDKQAEYERLYAQYEHLPQPHIAATRLEIALYPSQRRVEAKGHYHLVNRQSTSIAELHLTLLYPETELRSVSLPDSALQSYNKDFNYRIYKLPEPLAPGAEMDLDFSLALAYQGFGNDRGNTGVVGNGSFLNDMQLLPSFGFNPNARIVDRNERRKRGLGEVPRMAKLEDEAARANHYIDQHSDWIDFEATVSTEADQIALAPGYLQKEWIENGRRYFHYKMDKPILNFYAFLSARWQVKKADWNGLPIEIYYDAQHAYNIDHMIAGVQDSLGYYSAQYSPYQFRQVRVLEFPGYDVFAQSFPNTIPYSENIGFIADLRNPDDIDYVYYITAHEVAHQWWGDQVVGGNMQGSTMLSESLAEYSALMIMEHKYGRDKMRRFLKYDLDRYLRSRSEELVEELPLYRVENQPYIHYRKGSLVFYRLRDELGEDKLNHALRSFIAAHAFKAAPYPTSLDLLKFIRAEANPAQQELITDLFEKITFYDNRVVDATAKKLANGKYAVTLQLHADKRHADGTGNETAAPVTEDFEIGLFARNADGDEKSEKTIYLNRHHVSGDQSLTIEVDELPYDAGIDPYNKLIDRVSDDNRKRVSLQ